MSEEPRDASLVDRAFREFAGSGRGGRAEEGVVQKVWQQDAG